MLLYILAVLSISGQKVLSQSSVPPFVCDSLSTSQPDARLNDTIVATVDESKFATTSEVKQIVHQICKGESGLGGLRLPGSKANYDVYNFVKCQLEEMPGLQIMTDDFEIGSWHPEGGSMYDAARLRVGDTDVQVASAMSYSLPTNGEFVSGQLLYVPGTANLSDIDLKGKIVLRDYNVLDIPVSLIANGAYYLSEDQRANINGSYARPFVTPFNEELLLVGNKGAAGYISMFNITREQVESYYGPHDGVYWQVPALFTGAEARKGLIEAAAVNRTASIRIDAKVSTARVPQLSALLPGESDETIVIATHLDGATYVQENGPAALLTLARYFSMLPKSERRKSILFAFRSSHLAFQRDSDKQLATMIDQTYETNNVSFVIAIEHLGAREILPVPAADGVGTTLNYTGRPETTLWSVGPVTPAIDIVAGVVKSRDLQATLVGPGFPPADPSAVPLYQSFGGLGTYYNTALIPTMALIEGPWSLWAPYFGADAIDYDVLRLQHMAIGDVVLGLMEHSKDQLAGNYTMYRQQRAQGAKTGNINEVFSQEIVNGEVDEGSTV